MFLLSVLIIIVCVLLVLVILIQNSKGGGIQSQYGAATQIMGVKRGTEFIEKATWGLAIALIIFSVWMSPQGTSSAGNNDDNGSVTKRKAATAVSTPVQQQAPVQQQPAGPGAQPQQAPAQPGH